MLSRKNLFYFTILSFLLAVLFAQPVQSRAQDELNFPAQAKTQEQAQQTAQVLAQDERDYSADVDGDGLSNDAERNGWCNAVGCFTTDPLDSDSDDDGLTDGEEKLFDAHPLNNHSPGIYVEYSTDLQTKRFYPWQRFGSQYIALPTPGKDAIIVRRGSTFSVGGPVGATLTISKSIVSLTTLTPVRDNCAGRWNVAIPSSGTAGIYGITITDGSWSKSLNLYVIFQLPTGQSDTFIDSFVYDDNPNSNRDTWSIGYYETETETDPYEYTHTNYAWIPEGEWIAKGWVWHYDTEHYYDFIMPHVISTINGYSNTWDAANALVQHVDDVTCFGNPRPLGDSWCVLNPSQCYPEYNNKNQCTNIANLLTSFLRAAGIPARPLFTDWVHSTFDHSTEVWTAGASGGTPGWYVARGYNTNEFAVTGGCPSPNYSGGNVRLRSTSGWYSGSSTQGVYAVGENWVNSQVWGGSPYDDIFRMASWDLDRTARTARIVKKDWFESRFRAYWNWPAEPVVTGIPPSNWPSLPPPPVAAFIANPLAGARPLTVTLTNQSTGHISSRVWSFGDGITSILQNPIHTYSAAGNFSVTLVITGAGGSTTATRNNYIQVNELPPSANFTASPNSGTWPLAVVFTDTSTGVITNWSWNFGDGSTATMQHPTHTYASTGNFNVSLTVTGPGGSDIETRTNYIHVGEPTPVADFTASPLSGTRPLTVTLTDLSTGTITSWLWNFGDGTTSIEQNPSHTYDTVGDFTVSLTVDGPNGSNTRSRPNYIQVQNQQLGTQGSSPQSVDSTSIKLEQVIGDSAVDLDGDGRANQLVFKIQVNVGKTGTYWFRGQLAGNRIEAIGNAYLTQGKHTVELPFSGQEIFLNKLDGPYTLQTLSVTDVANPGPADFADRTLAFLSPSYKTRAYRFKDFGIVGAEFAGSISHRAIDTDGDRYVDTLIVETNLNIEKPGKYSVQGVLKTGSNTPPTTATWSGSTSKVILEFKGLRGTIGPYILQGLHARNAAQQVTDGIKEPFDLGSIPELSAKRITLSDTTPASPSLPAPRIGITNTGYSDLAVDTDNDGRFDQLVITVGVQVASNEGGQAYRLEGWLADVNGSLFAWSISTPVTLAVGTQNLSLAFDGRIINEHRVNGPFTLVALKIIPGSTYQVLDAVDVAYTTSSYDYTSFKASAIAPIMNTFSDNLESGTTQWTATNPPWSLDNIAWFSYSHAWKASATGARTGALTLSNSSLTNYAQATLRLKTCYNMQSTNDRGYLEASADGINWTRVSTYTNSTPHWTTVQLNLSQWGKMPNLRFNANSQTGLLWYIDDVNFYGFPAVSSASFAYSPQPVLVNTNTTFTASYTSISTTLPITYTWDFGDGSNQVVSNSPTTTHQFLSAGNRTIRVTVENPYDRQEASQLVTVGQAATSVSFMSNPTKPTVGNSATFTATITPPSATQPVTYTWNFGDGSSPIVTTQITVSHAFSSTGSYTAILTATNGYGSPVVYTNAISVGRSVTSTTCVSSPAKPLEGSSATFTATITPTNATQPVTYTWNFGDSSSPVVTTQTTVSHTFSSMGTFTTTLAATNGYGSPAVYAKSVSVGRAVTSVSFMSNPTKPTVGSAATFTATITPPSATQPVTYTWNFGDGSSPIVTTQITVSHAFSSTGSYTAILTATNGYGSPVVYTNAISVGRGVTSTTFTSGPTKPLEDDLITFTATITPTSATQPVTYTWDFGDGGTLSTTPPSATHAFERPGTYSVRVIATNGYGSPASYTKSVAVDGRPVSSVSFSVVPAIPNTNVPAIFTVTSTPINATNPITYTWNFGDGSSPIVTTTNALGHNFSQAGRHTVSITATNGYGPIVVFSQAITVDYQRFYFPAIGK